MSDFYEYRGPNYRGDIFNYDHFSDYFVKPKNIGFDCIENHTGTKMYYFDGVLHREDGPALESKDGNKEWWLNGKEFTESEFNSVALAKNLDLELTNKPLARKVKI